MTSRLYSLAQFLYRWRWVTSAFFVVIFFGLLRVDERPKTDALSWVGFGIAASLIWIPVAVRWLVATRDSGKAFRDGLSDG